MSGRDWKATAIAVGALLLLALAVGYALLGCRPADVPDPGREIARASVRVGVDAVEALDHACAAAVTARKDRELGERCDAFYRRARPALIAAGIVVDRWDDLRDRQRVTCAVVTVARELGELADDVPDIDGKSLEEITDALALASRLGSCASNDPLDAGKDGAR